MIAPAPPSAIALKKIQQEEARAAFRSRLAGIKSTVNNLNSRLTDIEVDNKTSPKPPSLSALEEAEAKNDEQDRFL